jgi:hypothetical protein
LRRWLRDAALRLGYRTDKNYNDEGQYELVSARKIRE